jgi:lipid A 3-O-deacylase
MNKRQSIGAGIELITLGICLMSGPDSRAQQQPPEPPPPSIWAGEIGSGFQLGAEMVTFEAGAQYGIAAFGGREEHHLALGSVSYGHMLTGVVGEDHWYRGNLELRAELFGGPQFSPDEDWLVGLTPHLRYDFATGTRWIPFVDVGAGVSATGIGRPDLGGTFEFNAQGAIGVHRVLRRNLALSFEARYMHISSAGIHEPNLGVNGVMGLVGLTWFF